MTKLPQAGTSRVYQVVPGRKVANVPLTTLVDERIEGDELSHVRVREGFPEADMLTISLDDDEGKLSRVLRNKEGRATTLVRVPDGTYSVTVRFYDDYIEVEPLERRRESNGYTSAHAWPHHSRRSR